MKIIVFLIGIVKVELCYKEEELPEDLKKNLQKDDTVTETNHKAKLKFYLLENFPITKTSYSSLKSGKKKDRGIFQAINLQEGQKVQGVVRYRFCVVNKSHISVFTERVQENLKKTIKVFQAFDWRKKLTLIRSLVNAFEEIHTMEFVHCDIKPRNIALSLDGNSIKIIQLSSMMDFNQKRKIYTPFYAIPRVFSQSEELVHPCQDAWSLSITIFELLIPDFRGKLKKFNSDVDAKRITRDMLPYIEEQLMSLEKSTGIPFHEKMSHWLTKDYTPKNKLKPRRMIKNIDRIIDSLDANDETESKF